MSFEIRASYGPIASEIALNSETYEYSPPRRGRLYDVEFAIDEDGFQWVVKTLGAQTIWEYYRTQPPLEDIFETHVWEHELYLRNLGRFVLPTTFFIVDDGNGPIYRVIQPRVENFIQYKEAREHGREVPLRQLPSFSDRQELYDGFESLGSDSFGQGRLPDIDFMITNFGKGPEFVISDTNYMWFPRSEMDFFKLFGRLSDFLRI